MVTKSQPEPFFIQEAKTDHIQRKLLDLSYASLSPAQKLDIYWPSEGNGPFPVIVSIHGGAFLGGDKRDGQIVPMLAGLERGFAVVGVNYRLSGEAKFPALVPDRQLGRLGRRLSFVNGWCVCRGSRIERSIAWQPGSARYRPGCGGLVPAHRFPEDG